MKPTHFATASLFRRWLARHHAGAPELWVGFFHRRSGKGGMTYSQALDQALCFGWIDGVRKNFDEARYVIRFTPRKPKSYWSAVNVKRAEALKARGLMQPLGLEAFKRRDAGTTPHHPSENRPGELEAGYLRKLRANRKAWAFFQSQPPWFRRTAAFWVMSAKQEATRERRLAALIAAAEARRRPGPFLVAAQDRR